MVGSWAGAMGHPQFLPSNYLTLAVDRDGSGAPDLWTSLPDALASAANHLVDDDWQRNLPWGLEVKLPANFPYGEAELGSGPADRPLAAARRDAHRRIGAAEPAGRHVDPACWRAIRGRPSWSPRISR